MLIANWAFADEIRVKKLDGDIITIDISPSAKVIELKQKISEIIGKDPEEFILYYKYKKLEKTGISFYGDVVEYYHNLDNDKTLNEYPNIFDQKNTVNIVSHFEYTINTLTGKRFNIGNIDVKTTVRQFKERIFEETKFPVNQQRLIINGKQMDDDAKVSAHYNPNLYNIHLILKK